MLKGSKRFAKLRFIVRGFLPLFQQWPANGFLCVLKCRLISEKQKNKKRRQVVSFPSPFLNNYFNNLLETIKEDWVKKEMLINTIIMQHLDKIIIYLNSIAVHLHK